MARSRRRSKPKWITLPIWAVTTLVVGWGIWQVAEFRRTLLADAPPPPAITEPAAPADVPAPVADSQPAEAPADADPWSATATAPSNASPAPDPLLESSHASAATAPVALPSVADTPTDIDALIARGLTLLDADRIIEGRSDLNAALAHLPEEDPRADTLRQQLASLNTGIFLGSAVLPGDPAAKYVNIQHGDTFLKLAHRYAIPAAFLADINPNLNPRNLKPMTGIKVVRGPFHIRLIKHADRIDLYARELYVRSFPAEFDDATYLPRGLYRLASGTKIQLAPSRVWIGFEGTDADTRDLPLGWIYGSAGPRGARASQDRSPGLKLADSDLRQLYNVLIENRSLLRVDP